MSQEVKDYSYDKPTKWKLKLRSNDKYTQTTSLKISARAREMGQKEWTNEKEGQGAQTVDAVKNYYPLRVY